MIKYDGGCEFSGTKIDLISELTLIMKRMVEKISKASARFVFVTVMFRNN